MKAKLLIAGTFLMLIALVSGCVQGVNKEQLKENLGDEILNIGECIPEGWNCTIMTQNLEEIPRPHGVWKPLAIVNFVNPTVEFETPYGEFNPSLRLYFYGIAEKQEIMEIIAIESVYSWCTPMYFDETKKYIIVTSPCYINSGVFTEEAKNYYSPLEQSLREYFDKFK